jgi:hypothetical protein
MDTSLLELPPVAHRSAFCSYRYFLSHLALFTFLLGSTTLLLVLYLCYRNDHLPPEFPSPSDTGVFQPESSFFSFGLLWTMISLAATMFRHYLLLSHFLSCLQRDKNLLTNETNKNRSLASSAILLPLVLFARFLCSPKCYPRRGNGNKGKEKQVHRERAKDKKTSYSKVNLLQSATLWGICGAAAGTGVACFQVRQHMLIHTITAAVLFVCINVYYTLFIGLCPSMLFGSCQPFGFSNSTTYASGGAVEDCKISSQENNFVLDTVEIAQDKSLNSIDEQDWLKLRAISNVYKNEFFSEQDKTKPYLAKKSQSHARSHLPITRIMWVLLSWSCLFGIIILRVIFIYYGGWNKQFVEWKMEVIKGANLCEWVWLVLVAVQGYLIFYKDSHLLRLDRLYQIATSVDSAPPDINLL